MANVIKHKRGSGSDPSASNLVVGELAIRTDTGKLFTKMDSGALAEIAGGGSDIAINTLSSSSATGGGSATFNGSAYRFTLSSPPSVSAAQLLVSVNGVIQKPVAGTGQPSEGFSVSGNDIIFGDAPATGADFFILTFRSLGVSVPADNSVTSAKIVDGAIVNADINASAAIAGSKISPTFTSSVILNQGVPEIQLNATSHENDFRIINYQGNYIVQDVDALNNRFVIQSDGTTIFSGNVDCSAGIDVTGAITGTGDMTIDTNTLHVDSSNNRVGIGTSSPLNTLHCHGDGTLRISPSAGANQFESGRIRFTENMSDFQGAYVHYDGNANIFHIGTHAANDTVAANDLNAISIPRGSGNVGIGTTSPEDLLHIKSGKLRIENAIVSNNDSTISYDNQEFIIDVDPNNVRGSSKFQIKIDTVTALTIDDNRRVGIGTTNPLVNLQVESTDPNIYLTNVSGNTNPSNAGTIHFREAPSTPSFFIFHNGQSNKLIFGGINNGNTFSHITLDRGDANISAGGNIIIPNGNGIDFSATSDASGKSSELLDDYEEGTWTVTLRPGSGEFTPTSNTSTGFYTKIGRQVTVMGIAQMTTPSNLGSYNNANINDALQVTGLPFTIFDNIHARSVATLGVGGDIQFPNGVLATHGNNNSTNFVIFVNLSSGGTRVSPTLSTNTAMNFHFSFTYFTS